MEISSSDVGQRILEDLPAAGEYCSVSTGTRLIGDRWSLLLVRELALGNRRFGGIHEALPGLSRSLLASRLRYLEHLGIVRKEIAAKSRRSPHHYVLTNTGEGLIPVLEALGKWVDSSRFRDETEVESDAARALRRARDSVDRTLLPGGRISIQFVFSDGQDARGWLRVDDRGARTCDGSVESPADLTVRASTEVFDALWWGRRSCRDVIARGDITFVASQPSLAQAFSSWFPNRPAINGVHAALAS